MNIKLSKNNYFNSDEIHLYHNKLIINNNKYKINREISIIKENDIDLNLFFLYNEFNRIRRLNKFKDFLVIFSDNIEGIFIEFSVNIHNQNTQDITIYIGYDFIYNTSANDILVFFCHELGHLLDSKNINDAYIRLEKTKKTSAWILTALVIYTFIYFRKELLFSTISILLILLIKIVTNKLFFLLQQKISRNQEFRADEFAVYLMRSPDKVLKSYEFLQTIYNQPEKNLLTDSHPTLPQRISYIKANFWFALFLNKIFKI
jgi:hypothetical protein